MCFEEEEEEEAKDWEGWMLGLSLRASRPVLENGDRGMFMRLGFLRSPYR